VVLVEVVVDAAACQRGLGILHRIAGNAARGRGLPGRAGGRGGGGLARRGRRLARGLRRAAEDERGENGERNDADGGLHGGLLPERVMLQIIFIQKYLRK